METPDEAYTPRNCHVIQWPDFDGYGFNLHAEKNRTGQFIGKVDEDSPAELAGLRYGDRIIEVNGVNIANENHKQVVTRIKAVPKETKLLVVDEQTDQHYKEKNIVVKSSLKSVIHLKTPVPRPGLKQTIEEINVPEPVVDEEELPPQLETEVDEESGESVREVTDVEKENGNVESTTEEIIKSTTEEIVKSEPSPTTESIDETPPTPPLSVSKLEDAQNEENVDNLKNEKVNDISDEEKSDIINDQRVDDENEKNNRLETENDRDSLKSDKLEPTPVIEDNLQEENIQDSLPPKIITPVQESPVSNRSTPPTTPATPEPVIEKPEIETSNGHTVNGQESNGHKSGLNLNMSAQEMRQMLAQRKKRDVRKEQVDMITKYNMIQKM